jgi:transcriptional repressor NrdR
MKCPYCYSAETKVIDKRETEGLEVTRRRRECLKCTKRFTTYERVEMIDLIIIKKDDKREQYDRNKLKRGVMRACEKRPISHEKIERAIDNIEAKLRSYKKNEIRSETVGELVIKQLKKLDKVAYIRFASVYRDFTDVESFQKELKKLLKK